MKYCTTQQLTYKLFEDIQKSVNFPKNDYEQKEFGLFLYKNRKKEKLLVNWYCGVLMMDLRILYDDCYRYVI